MTDCVALKVRASELMAARDVAKLAAIEAQSALVAAEQRPRGLRAVVTRGRKVPKGTVGTIFNAGESRFGLWAQFDRDDTGERVMLNLDNLTICDEHFAQLVAARDDAQAALASAEQDLRWAQAEYRAAVMAKAGIDLTVRSESTLEQAAYRDYVRFLTPCAAEATDDDIRVALAFADPQGSCWGSLRWSCGTSLVERVSPTLIRVESATGIAD